MSRVISIFPWGQTTTEEGKAVIRAGSLCVGQKSRRKLTEAIAPPERAGSFQVILYFEGEELRASFERSSQAAQFYRDCMSAIRCSTVVSPLEGVSLLDLAASTAPSSAATSSKSENIDSALTSGSSEKAARPTDRLDVVPEAPLTVASPLRKSVTPPMDSLHAADTVRSLSPATPEAAPRPEPAADQTAILPFRTEQWVDDHWHLAEEVFALTRSRCEIKLRRRKSSNHAEVLKKVRNKDFMARSSCVSVETEAVLLSSIKHPHVVEMIEAFRVEGWVYIVLEYIAGGTIHDNVDRKGPFAEQLGSRLFSEICSAVDYIHGLGIAHRDIKCENVLLTSEDRGAGVSAKLSDFGISRHARNSHDCRTYCGSRTYMAPEVSRLGDLHATQSVESPKVSRAQMYPQSAQQGSSQMLLEDPAKVCEEELGYGRAADMYSLGVLLHLMLTRLEPKKDSGELVFPDEGSESTVDACNAFQRPRLSSLVKELLRHLMAFDPRNRPSASAVLDHEWLMSWIQRTPKRRCRVDIRDEVTPVGQQHKHSLHEMTAEKLRKPSRFGEEAGGNGPRRLFTPCVVLTDFNVVSRQAPPHAQQLPGRVLPRDATSDEPQVQLLEAMNRQFNAECKSGGSFILGAATWAEKTVMFIKLKDLDEIVGYMAFQENYPHGVLSNIPTLPQPDRDLAETVPSHLRVLQHLWVSPKYRRQGIAREALHLCFAKDSHCIIEAPVPSTMSAITSLGWALCGARFAGDSILCRYVQTCPGTSAALALASK